VLAFEFLLTVVIAAIMYAQGEAARDGLIRFGRRLAGERGESVITLAGQAIRAVALGVVVTALVQTVLAGLGLFVTGVPFAGFLTAVILLLCIAQIGPIIVLVPAVIWLYWSGDLWGTVLLVWSIAVGPLDNILRPILIRRGRRFTDAADLRGRDWGPGRVRHHRAVRRPRRARGELHVAKGPGG
jgi:predicted PurR-regulated permease PerM